MARKRRPKGSQTHPSGPLVTVDETWKGVVREVMLKSGWNQQDLAGKIPASTGAISNMFKPGDRQIRQRTKTRIEELCGFGEDTKKLEEVLSRIEGTWPMLSVEKAQLVLTLVETLVKKG